MGPFLKCEQDRVERVLMYRCRTCRNTEPANNYCVFRNNLSSNAGETAGVTTDIGSDPTVSSGAGTHVDVKSYACGCTVTQSLQGMPEVWRNGECVFPESAENRRHQDGGYSLANSGGPRCVDLL
jgi:hypothetical protein